MSKNTWLTDRAQGWKLKIFQIRQASLGYLGSGVLGGRVWYGAIRGSHPLHVKSYSKGLQFEYSSSNEAGLGLSGKPNAINILRGDSLHQHQDGLWTVYAIGLAAPCLLWAALHCFGGTQARVFVLRRSRDMRLAGACRNHTNSCRCVYEHLTLWFTVPSVHRSENI